MKILVCVKQVPDNELLQPNPDTGMVDRSAAGGIMNPYDAYAVEMALRLKDVTPSSVTLLSMGPEAAAKTLRVGLSLGADEAVLLCDGKFGGADTLSTSYALAAAVKRLESDGREFDLIICGLRATDGDTGQVGPELAERLNLPQITNTLSLSLNAEDCRITAERGCGAGDETVECALPCLITAGKPFCRLRQPTLKGKLAARRAEITVWRAEDLDIDPSKIGLRGSQTRVLRVFEPKRDKKAKMITEGTAREKAAFLSAILAGQEMGAN